MYVPRRVCHDHATDPLLNRMTSQVRIDKAVCHLSDGCRQRLIRQPLLGRPPLEPLGLVGLHCRPVNFDLKYSTKCHG